MDNSTVMFGCTEVLHAKGLCSITQCCPAVFHFNKLRMSTSFPIKAYYYYYYCCW